MPRVNTANTLARIWADAFPLAEYVSERANRSSREEPSTPKTRRGRKMSTVEMLAGITEAQVTLRVMRDKTRTATVNDLIAGRIIAVGRPSDVYNFERLDPSFWIGAAVDWDRDAASRDGRKVIDVRIVKPGDIPSVQPRLHEVPGRPSKSDVISAAIVEYAKTDPTLDRPPMERRSAYYVYIAARGYNPRRDKGFSEKTIQKFERLFRSKNN